MGVDDSVYLVTKRRTLKSLFEDSSKNQYCCQKPPLINIETDHIITDELHLLLRITDVLLKNVVATAVADDKKTMGVKWKLLDGKMLNSVVSNIRRCGIPFAIWDGNESNKDSYNFTSLVGNMKKKLLKFFPNKITQCQPGENASTVAKLWKVSLKPYINNKCINLLKLGFQGSL